MLGEQLAAVERYALGLLRTRRPDWSLPQPFYVEEGFFELDMKHLIRKQWLFAALSCEIPEAGNRVHVNFGPESVIIVRGHDRRIRAFHNTCRHRGSRICTGDRGTSSRLVCPYHQWTYELDGTFAHASHLSADLSRGELGLKGVHCEDVAGYIFVSLAEDPPPFARFRADVEPFIAAQGLMDAKVVHTQVMKVNANWKLVMENNRECYHCAIGHPELVRVLLTQEKPNDPLITSEHDALIRQKYAEWAAAGIPHIPVEPNLRYRATRLPLRRGYQSITVDGKPACRKLMGSFEDFDLGSVRLLSLPNTWNHLLADHVIAFRVSPTSAMETTITTKWLVHKDATEGVDYDIERLTELWSLTNEQDRTLIERNQAGVASMAYEPGPYSGVIELGVRDFISWYSYNLEASLCRTLGLPFGAKEPAAQNR